MPTQRKNQKNMTAAEWTAFINAINSLHGVTAPKPAYRYFVKVHVQAMTSAVGMTWEVHTMPSMNMQGFNFLSWHRWLLRRFELQLQKIDPNVAVPYWVSPVDRAIPAALSSPALLQSWSVQRDTFDQSQIPAMSQFDHVQTLTSYRGYESQLEALHGGTHNAIGGDMGGAGSPTDPVFWLHHAFIDRQWALRQAKPGLTADPYLTHTLKPKVIFKKPSGSAVKVSDVEKIATLGYSYV